jgi:hypothetical protein
MDSVSEPVRFETKIAVLLRDDLEVRQRLNVTSSLVSGIGQRAPEVIGEPYADADGTQYLPMFRQPVLVFEGSKEALITSHRRAVSRENLDLVGIAVYGPRNAVDKIVKGARMHP